MVRAVAATSYGGPEVIQVIDVDPVPPGPGRVVVEVRATALNPWDAKVAEGMMGTDPAKLPMRLGSEASGVVTAVGEGAVDLQGDALAVGDRVYGHRLAGAQASELTVPAEGLVRLPDDADYREAAGLMSVGTTAVHALEVTRAGEGDVVLVHGASGGVGRIAVQLARLRGATVVGTASPRHHDDLRELGVIPVAYGEGLLERVREAAPDGVDAAVDTAGTDEAVATTLAVLHDPARFVTIHNSAFEAVKAAGGLAIGGGPGADPGTEIRHAAQFELARRFAGGELRVEVSATFPIEKAREAYELLVGGHAGGKVVLEP